MTKNLNRRLWLGHTAVGLCLGATLPGCGGSGGSTDTGASNGSGSGSGSGSGTGSTAAWSLAQSNRNNWIWHTPTWQGGDRLGLSGVSAGSTLVLCVWGYVGQGGAGFRLPVDSQGQTIVKAADAGLDARIPVQATAWVLHNAAAGDHTWTNLPDFGSQGFGDGVAVLMEFRRDGTPSSTVLGVGSQTLNDTSAPWFTSGSVTMSAGAQAGDLLVAFSFQEEATAGSAFTTYTHPPAGWNDVAVQEYSVDNIAGNVSWRLAPDALPQTVTWNWTYAAGQDPSIFKALIFAVR